jgi:pimeloyl-ACP methyl ester carboxylesterase
MNVYLQKRSSYLNASQYLPCSMMRSLISIVFLFLLAISPAKADVMLLIHGYLADATSWERSGINEALHRRGWSRAGMFQGSPFGPRLFTIDSEAAENRVYVATLPFEMPIVVQADILKQTIGIIRQLHPDEEIILVGHSAGGVVARMTLIRHQPEDVKALITIATPHLGTGRADQALSITRNHGPFNMVKHFVGGSTYDALRHSRGLFYDLRHPYPGNLLYWLNSQAHPDIHYASIIRTDHRGMVGDDIVPGFSQDMNNIPALQGRSSVFTTPASHYLNFQDAHTILAIIDRI